MYRGVAQLGSALALGARCRRFKSCRPDSVSPDANLRLCHDEGQRIRTWRLANPGPLGVKTTGATGIRQPEAGSPSAPRPPPQPPCQDCPTDKTTQPTHIPAFFTNGCPGIQTRTLVHGLRSYTGPKDPCCLHCGSANVQCNIKHQNQPLDGDGVAAWFFVAPPAHSYLRDLNSCPRASLPAKSTTALIQKGSPPAWAGRGTGYQMASGWVRWNHRSPPLGGHRSIHGAEFAVMVPTG